MSVEPTAEQVVEAIRCLPRTDLVELAKGPIEDTDDPDRCRFCEWFDADLYDRRQWSPAAEAVTLLVDWHRWWGDPDFHAGRGPEAHRRCLVIYGLAGRVLAEQDLAVRDEARPSIDLTLKFDGVSFDQARARVNAIARELDRLDNLTVRINWAWPGAYVSDKTRPADPVS